MISAVLLAAGLSRRMGRNKLLLPLGGRTLLEHSLQALLDSAAGETVVVIGHEADRVRPLLGRYPVRVVENPDYAQGMSTSLRAGVAAVSPQAVAVLIALADQPLVGRQDIDRLIEAYRRTGKKIVVPSVGDRRGNPVLLDLSLRPEIERLTGDTGGRHILHSHPDDIEPVPMPTGGSLFDVDTADDYRALQDRDTPP